MHFPKIKHPEWLKEPESQIEKVMKLIRQKKMPDKIAGWMIVVAAKQPLRAVYGSNLRAALALLVSALHDLWREWTYRCIRRHLPKEKRLQAEFEAMEKKENFGEGE